MSLDDWWVTPRRRFKDLPKEITLDVKIDVFSERVNGWKLDIADQLINGVKNEKGEVIIEGNPHAGYSVLDIILSYFEMIAKYREGFIGEYRNGRFCQNSREYFKKGVRIVFQEELAQKDPYIVENFLNTLYSGARNGTYHNGFAGTGIFIQGGSSRALVFSSNTKQVIINPHRLVLVLKYHFTDYITQLKDKNNTELRNNFEKKFDKEQSQA